MTHQPTVNERVTAGAAWLDVNNPGWERSVDLDRLDIESADFCICGQSFNPTDANYQSGYDMAIELAIDNGDIRSHKVATMIGLLTPSWSHDHGFLALGPDDAGLLDAAWITLIKTRFDTGCLSDG